MAVPIATWSVQAVGDWLESLELGQHRQAFLASSIDGALLLALGPADMSDLGVKNKCAPPCQHPLGDHSGHACRGRASAASPRRFHAKKILTRRDRLVAEEAAADSAAPQEPQASHSGAGAAADQVCRLAQPPSERAGARERPAYDRPP